MWNSMELLIRWVLYACSKSYIIGNLEIRSQEIMLLADLIYIFSIEIEISKLAIILGSMRTCAAV
jgi:hypothetical protein